MSAGRYDQADRAAEDGQRYWQDRCREHIKARNELRADLDTTRAALRAVEKLADAIRQALAGIDAGRQV